MGVRFLGSGHILHCTALTITIGSFLVNMIAVQSNTSPSCGPSWLIYTASDSAPSTHDASFDEPAAHSEPAASPSQPACRRKGIHSSQQYTREKTSSRVQDWSFPVVADRLDTAAAFPDRESCALECNCRLFDVGGDKSLQSQQQ